MVTGEFVLEVMMASASESEESADDGGRESEL